MKILVDLQACQTADSRRRGIGRYALDMARALIRRRGRHGIHVLLNALHEPDRELAATLEREGELVVERVELLHATAGTVETSQRRRLNDEILDWRYACTGADVLHVCSVFEGWQSADAHVSETLSDVGASLRSATLYDLIPLIFESHYLPPELRPQYLRRLAVFQRMDLVFAISESSRRDAIERLHLAPDRVITSGAAASSAFRLLDQDELSTMPQVVRQFDLGSRFVLYTGGMDYRKNVDVLLRSFAALPLALAAQLKLAIVCAISDEDRARLGVRLGELGLQGRVVFTGFLSDDALNVLYNACELFVFPSLYEGFGLPVLEAMQCGASVIASGTSSMPEILGRADVSFDPADPHALTELMTRVLSSPALQQEMSEANLRRSRFFSWDTVADRMIGAWEESHDRLLHNRCVNPTARRPRVAMVTPLPPQKTGIGAYSASMLPYWARHFDLELVCDGATPRADIAAAYTCISLEEFERRYADFDCAVYHFGNSPYHAGMYRMLPRCPGIVVMHDFFLSGLLQWFEIVAGQSGLFNRELAASHGVDAAVELAEVVRGDRRLEELVARYPVSRRVLEHARGVIFHSEFARSMMATFYPDLAAIPNCVVAQACVTPPEIIGRAQARRSLGLQSGDLLICAFGFLVETKDNPLLLEAVAAEQFANDPRLRLVYVGEVAPGPLGTEMTTRIEAHAMRERIQVTGYVSDEAYSTYMAACDVAVSLRSNSRGETSAATLRQMAAGCASIVSDHGAMRELPADVALKVGTGEVHELRAALARLLDDAELRARLGAAAKSWAERACHPVLVAEQYAAALTSLQDLDRARSAGSLVTRVARIAASEGDAGPAAQAAASAIADGVRAYPATARWLGAVQQ